MTLESLKIVIAEADEKISGAVKEYIESNGAKVYIAENGHEALSKIRKSKPDVIILETFLPGIDGLKLCGLLKKDKRTKHIPIIFLTTRDDVVDKVIGLEYGASDYITKPFSLRELEARIKAVLRNLPAKQSPGLNASNDEVAEEDVSDSVAVLFDFPEEVRVPCEQYLLYFGQFLRDLGVQATSDREPRGGASPLHRHAGRPTHGPR